MAKDHAPSQSVKARGRSFALRDTKLSKAAKTCSLLLPSWRMDLPRRKATKPILSVLFGLSGP